MPYIHLENKGDFRQRSKYNLTVNSYWNATESGAGRRAETRHLCIDP